MTDSDPHSPGEADPIVLEHQAQTVPWERRDFAPEVPAQAAAQDTCGYHQGSRLIACGPEKLADTVAKDTGRQLTWVWVPGMTHMSPPEELPFLYDAVRERRRRRLRSSISNGLLFTAMWAALALWMEDGQGGSMRPLFIFFMVAFGLIPLGEGLWGLLRLGRFTPDRMDEYAAEARYWTWVRDRGAPWTGRLTMLLAAIGMVQVVNALQHLGSEAHSSLLLVGIDKEAVRAGEWWRLLTGTLIHANILHFLFNIAAFRVLGKLVEVLTDWALVVVVFLAAALAGSLCSLVFMPEALSVGSSGGIMGLLGFLVVIAWRQRQILPMAFMRAMLLGAFYMAVIGVIGYAFIDNAAHGGGFVAGALVGMLSRSSRESVPTGASSRMRGAAAASMIILALFSCLTILLIMKGP